MAKRTHGLSGTKLHEKWRAMMARCYNKNCEAYKNYGARGITVCDEWQDFLNFYRDNLPHETSGLTIDRIDVTKGYSKENCQWVSMKAQANNKRDTVRITFNGEEKTLLEWSNELGIGYATLWSRLFESHMPVEKAFSSAVGLWNTDAPAMRRTNRFVTFNGVTKNLMQWCRDLGLKYATVSARIHKQNLEPVVALGLVAEGSL